MSKYQQDDMIFVIPVVDAQGNAVDPSDYTDAVFSISTPTGIELFKGRLNTDITVVNSQFEVVVPGTATNHSGQVIYEMRVWSANGSSKTIHKSIDNFVKTTIERTQA